MPKYFIAVWFSALIVSGLIVFSTGWSTPFVLDATNKIANNPDVQTAELHWGALFDAYSAERAKGTHLRNDPSRPLVYLCYWLLWRAGDGNPLPFHLFATALHIGCALLLGWLALQLALPAAGAVIASFLFLLWPINAGTVLYPFALSDGLAAFFTLAILNLARLKPSSLTLITAGAAYVLALGAKQSAVVTPALLFALAPHARRLIQITAVQTAAYLAARFAYFGGIGDLEAEQTFAPLDYFLAQGTMLWKYVWLTLFPRGLCIDHAVRLADYPPMIKILGWAGVGAAVYFLWRRQPALWLLLLPLLPTSSFLPTTDLFVERRMYLASAGLALMLGHAWPARKAAVAAAGIALLLYAGLSYRRAASWSTGAAAIYQEVLNLYPGEPRTLNNLATIELQNGNYPEAKKSLEAVLHADPRNIEAISNLGALHQLPASPFFSFQKAEQYYMQTLSIYPTHVNTLRNLGFLYLESRRYREARETFQAVLQLHPRSAIALAGLGRAEELSGNREEAARLFKAALAEDPGQGMALDGLRRLGR